MKNLSASSWTCDVIEPELFLARSWVVSARTYSYCYKWPHHTEECGLKQVSPQRVEYKEAGIHRAFQAISFQFALVGENSSLETWRVFDSDVLCVCVMQSGVCMREGGQGSWGPLMRCKWGAKNFVGSSFSVTSKQWFPFPPLRSRAGAGVSCPSVMKISRSSWMQGAPPRLQDVWARWAHPLYQNLTGNGLVVALEQGHGHLTVVRAAQALVQGALGIPPKENASKPLATILIVCGWAQWEGLPTHQSSSAGSLCLDHHHPSPAPGLIGPLSRFPSLSFICIRSKHFLINVVAFHLAWW